MLDLVDVVAQVFAGWRFLLSPRVLGSILLPVFVWWALRHGS